MKKLALLSVLLLSAGYASAQKYSSKTGKVTFEASVPLFDDILLRMRTMLSFSMQTMVKWRQFQMSKTFILKQN